VLLARAGVLAKVPMAQLMASPLGMLPRPLVAASNHALPRVQPGRLRPRARADNRTQWTVRWRRREAKTEQRVALADAHASHHPDNSPGWLRPHPESKRQVLPESALAQLRLLTGNHPAKTFLRLSKAGGGDVWRHLHTFVRPQRTPPLRQSNDLWLPRGSIHPASVPIS
jgi:hypothetical protein